MRVFYTVSARKCILDFCQWPITYSYIFSTSTWGSLNVFTQGINKISLGCLKVSKRHNISPRANIDQQICHVLQHLLDRLLPNENRINVKKINIAILIVIKELLALPFQYYISYL